MNVTHLIKYRVPGDVIPGLGSGLDCAGNNERVGHTFPVDSILEPFVVSGSDEDGIDDVTGGDPAAGAAVELGGASGPPSQIAKEVAAEMWSARRSGAIVGYVS